MQIFNETRTATLRAAIDRIIPPDDFCAGGLDAGVYDFFVRNLTPGGYFPHLVAEYEAGLDAIEALSRKMYSAAFVELEAGPQDAVLVQFETEEPGFFRMFVEQAQEGFYTSPAGFHMVGWKVTG